MGAAKLTTPHSTLYSARHTGQRGGANLQPCQVLHSRDEIIMKKYTYIYLSAVCAALWQRSGWIRYRIWAVCKRKIRSYIPCIMKPNIAILSKKYNHILTNLLLYRTVHKHILSKTCLNLMLRSPTCASKYITFSDSIIFILFYE